MPVDSEVKNAINNFMTDEDSKKQLEMLEEANKSNYCENLK
jgi:hypothetical protein